MVKRKRELKVKKKLDAIRSKIIAERQEQKKQYALSKNLWREKPQPIVNSSKIEAMQEQLEESIQSKLEKNNKILEALYDQMLASETNRTLLNSQLEEAGAKTLEEKVNFLKEKFSELAEKKVDDTK